MARIRTPEVKAILTETGLPLRTLGFRDDSEASRDINLLLPDIIRSVNMAVDKAARPLQFPFNDADLEAASPWKSDAEIAEEKQDQQGEVLLWVTTAAAAKLVGRAVGRQGLAPGAQNPVKDRYDELVSERELHRTTALDAIAAVAAASPAGQAQAVADAAAKPRIRPSGSIRVKRVI
jgi:hypothetical protein